MLYRIILLIIHKCIAVFINLQLKLREICRSAQHFASLLPFYPELKKSACDFSFKKLPSHLGIIICEDEISFSDISNILVWSFCLGIHNISLYDSSGYIKFNGSELYKEMNRRKTQLLKDAACSFDVTFFDGKNPFSYNISLKNGHRTEDVTVYLLSQEDGKQQIIETAKNICKIAKKQPRLLEQFNGLHFNNSMKAVINVPDPELILLFGQSHGLIGYLPWHIRLTEIIHQLTHHRYSLEELKNILYRFNKCEQRFGK